MLLSTIEPEPSVPDEPQDDPIAALMQRRQGPEFCIIEPSTLAVLFAWPARTKMFDEPELRELVGQLVAGLRASGESARATGWEPYRKGVYLRVMALLGPGLDAYAVFFERSRELATVATFAARFRLSKRESEVLALLIRGYDTKLIATSLSIATTTARDHIVRIMHKSHSRRRTELVAMVVQGEA